MLNVVMLNAVMLNAVMLSVVAPMDFLAEHDQQNN
jgi:hypothetical protein